METHWIVESRASKTTASRSIATLTIVESRIVITAPQTTTAAAASTGRPSSRIPARSLTYTSNAGKSDGRASKSATMPGQ